MTRPLDKEASLVVSQDEEIRFWSYAKRGDGCWSWTGGKDRQGYGLCSFKRRMYRAARVAFTLTYGHIPKGNVVLHRCDNPPCVNPEHLLTGTFKDNTRDAAKKGRMATGIRNGAYTKPETRRNGVLNGRALLSEECVRKIRVTFATTVTTKAALARQYGVAESTISGIINRRLWGSLA